MGQHQDRGGFIGDLRHEQIVRIYTALLSASELVLAEFVAEPTQEIAAGEIERHCEVQPRNHVMIGGQIGIPQRVIEQELVERR